MAFARKYETYEVRWMLRHAEGVASPITGQAGHSRALHAMSPGRLDEAAQLRRVTKLPTESNKQFSARGGTGRTGAFMNQVQQAAAATDALNSPAGQAALAVFDAPEHAGVSVRIDLDVTGIKEASFLPGSLAPHSTSVAKGDKVVTTVGATAGVKLILDRKAGVASFHVQTCYPLADPAATTRWKATAMASGTVLASYPP